MAGRPRKPTVLKVLEGNPGKRPLPKNEPKPEPLAPKCPAHLDKAAKREWKRVVDLLEPLGLVNKLNMAALAAYCQVYSRWVEAEGMIRKHGMLVKTPNGYPQLSPFMTVANRCLDQMKSYMVEFGMTPASMSRISINPGEAKDDMESLLSGVK
jgi:P27 family predicted phage terminase small subunit